MNNDDKITLYYAICMHIMIYVREQILHFMFWIMGCTVHFR